MAPRGCAAQRAAGRRKQRNMACRFSKRSFVCASLAIFLLVAVTRYNLPWFENDDITVQSVQVKNPRGVKGKIAKRQRERERLATG